MAIDGWIVGGIVAGTILSVWGVFAKIIPLIKKAWYLMFLKAHDEIYRILSSVRGQLTNIESELKPNGGASLRDAVNDHNRSLNYLKLYFKASLHTNTKGIWETDSTGELVYCNRAFARITGFSEAQLKGSGWHNLIHPSDRQRAVKLWHQAVENQRDFNEVLTYVTATGEPYQCHVIGYVIMENNKLLGHLGEIIVDAPL